MSSVFGRRIRLSVFGESHGPAVGMTLDGLPPGVRIDWDAVAADMARRAPGNSPLATPRREKDEWELLSGVFQEYTTGAPLTAIIRNENTRSTDYTPHLPRPGHADLTARIKYGGFADYRGGGHFSGRLTAPLVLAGAIAKQVLARQGVTVGARILRLAGIADISLPPEEIPALAGKELPVFDDEAARRMRRAILDAKAAGDSVGGVVECAALGTPAGWGDPFFESAESVIAALLFSIPAVKGVEFGDGFALAEGTGSAANDQMEEKNGQITYRSNHNGGILGGITNGQPLIVRAVVKPTPTVSVPQTTVNLHTGAAQEVSFGGRHDPCIVPRAVPVVEAAVALGLLELRSQPA